MTQPMINSTGTVTADGFIPHLKSPYGFMMPVKVWANHNKPREMAKPLPPQRDTKGNLVYALPGGGAMAHRGGFFETLQMIG